MEVRCPPIDDALLDYLEAAFPDRAVNPAETDPNRAFGQQEVVRHLRAVSNNQQENPDVWT